MRWWTVLAHLALFSSPAAAAPADSLPRTLVMTAFAPEWAALEGAIAKPVAVTINGQTFLTGTLEGKPVVLMQSGVSMVNAAMNTQLALDHFAIKRIVFSGVAGGVDPGLSIGDVVVAERWGQYLEASFARATPKGWKPPERIAGAPANWNFIFPRGTSVTSANAPEKRLFTIPMDPALLALAQKVTPGVRLTRCVEPDSHSEVAAKSCLPHVPRIVVGGTGVSAGIFADNAAFRRYLFAAWHARVLDMESAAVAQAAYANGVPSIIFRSLSDLAGGDADRNMETAFDHLASVNSAKVVRAFVAALPD